jgi:hypothetical protein
MAWRVRMMHVQDIEASEAGNAEEPLGDDGHAGLAEALQAVEGGHEGERSGQDEKGNR